MLAFNSISMQILQYFRKIIGLQLFKYWLLMIELLTAFLDTEVGRDTKLHSTVEKCYLYGTLTTNHLFSQVDI